MWMTLNKLLNNSGTRRKDCKHTNIPHHTHLSLNLNIGHKYHIYYEAITAVTGKDFFIANACKKYFF